MTPFGYHPILTLDTELERHDTMFDETANEVYGDIDNCPRAVGMIVLASLAGIVAINLLGFRFAIGVGK